jgi:hypothetical protein
MYPPEERKVFSYHDGTANVFADPLEIDLRLKEALGGDPGPVYRDYNSEVQAQRDGATLKLIAAVRVAFDMPFDKATGKGASGTQCCKALWAFWEWLEKNGQPAASSQTGSRPSDASPMASPSPTPSTRK